MRIEETFSNRKTGFDDIVAFEKDFVEDRLRNERWKALIKKKKSMVVVDFISVINLIKLFLEPVIVKIIANEEMNSTWNSKKNEWA